MFVPKLLPSAALLLTIACGGTASVSSVRPSPSPPRLRNGAFGQLVKISGTTLVLSGTAGDVTVLYDSSTRLQRTSTAAVGDIVPGVCIFATGQKDATGSVTAAVVRITNPVAGSCAPARAGAPTPAAGAFGGFGGGGSARPTPPADFGFAAGLVTAVSGVQVTLQPLAGGASALTVPTTVRVAKTVAATAADLQVGECLTAAGRRDAAGTVQAAALTITPPGPSGTCTPGGGFGGFFRGGGGGGFGGGGAPEGG